MPRPRTKPRKRILRCPNCGSVHVQMVAGQITGQVYHCLDCNYQGSLILEVEVADDGTVLP
jgi:transposase-like protein